MNKLAFLHVPKTGGTIMRTASPCPYEIEPPQLAHTWRLQDFVGTNTRVFFFLRDPIDREISSYWERRNLVYRAKDPAFRELIEKDRFFPGKAPGRRWALNYPTPNDYIDHRRCTNQDLYSNRNGYTYFLGTLNEYLKHEDQVEVVLPFWDFEQGINYIRKLTNTNFELDYQLKRGRHDYVTDISDSLSPENTDYLMTKLEDEYRLYHYIRYSNKMTGDPK